MDKLEEQLRRFPRGKHDDVIDCLQMMYSLYEIQSSTIADDLMQLQVKYLD
jgi:phage terminase large subunit-like protein